MGVEVWLALASQLIGLKSYARYSMYTKKNIEQPKSYLSSLSVAIVLAIPFCPTVLSSNASTSRCHVGTPLFITWSVF